MGQRGNIDYDQIRCGGVAIKTADYTAIETDAWGCIVFNRTSSPTAAINFTLPATIPGILWSISVANIGGDAVTIKRNGHTIDGVAADLVGVGTDQGLEIYTDGFNWFTQRGFAGAGGSSILLQTNSVNNGSQSKLNLVAGSNVTLTDNGSGSVTVAASAGSAGALILLEAHTASNSATLDFTTAFTSTYDEYQVEIVSLIPVNNQAALELLVSTNGGSSWKSANYDWTTFAWTDNGSAATGNTSDSKCVLPQTGAAAQSNSAVGGMIGTLKLMNLLSTASYFQYTGEISWWAADARIRSTVVGGAYKDVTAGVNAIRFQYDSGNISSGVIRVYGIAH